MKTINTVVLDLSSLPEQARQEVTDFYLFLKKKYRPHSTRKKVLKKTLPPTFSDELFIGMWKDREDMSNAAEWVREQRESTWSRHE